MVRIHEKKKHRRNNKNYKHNGEMLFYLRTAKKFVFIQ
jgi:hypothetical protein